MSEYGQPLHRNFIVFPCEETRSNQILTFVAFGHYIPISGAICHAANTFAFR